MISYIAIVMRGNIIELPEKFAQHLSSLPESGRFIHKVKVTLDSGKILANRVVFNATILHLEDDEHISPEQITNIELEGSVSSSSPTFL